MPQDTADILRELRIDRSRARPRRRIPRWLFWGGLLAIVVLVAVALSSMRPTPVQVATTRSAEGGGPLSVLDASGYVVARRQATVSAKITGKVEQVLIEEGMRVDEGQVVATLDATDAQAQQRRAVAQLEAALTQVREGEAQLALAEADHARQRELAARGLASDSALDNAVAQRDLAGARLANARRQVEVARAGLAQADIAVDNHVIRTPFAGVVVAKAAQPGEMISPVSAGGGFTRTGIGTVVDMDSLEIEVDVNEAYIGRVDAGMAVEARLNAYPDWAIPAEVIAIIPTADRSKATVKVRIGFAERDPRIVPEMGVRVSFLEERAADAPPRTGVWAPQRAIVGEGAEAAVFVVAEGQVARRAVRLGERRDADRLVVEGLAPDEVVVLSPPRGLSDGDRVAVAE